MAEFISKSSSIFKPTVATTTTTTSIATESNVSERIWQKRKMSNARLRKFFGRSVQVDVKIQDIEKFGLDTMLASNVPLCYFLYSLLESYCAENLFFYLEVLQFEEYEFTSNEHLRRTAKSLYRSFIREEGDFEINIDGSIREPIKKSIENNDQTCFSNAKEHVRRLLMNNFIQFKLGTAYKRMWEDLEEQITPYDNKVRFKAVKLLLEYLDKSLPEEIRTMAALGLDSSQGKRRSYLIRQMIHTFCRSRLRLDFYDMEEGKNLPALSRPKSETASLTSDSMLKGFEFLQLGKAPKNHPPTSSSNHKNDRNQEMGTEKNNNPIPILSNLQSIPSNSASKKNNDNMNHKEEDKIFKNESEDKSQKRDIPEREEEKIKENSNSVNISPKPQNEIKAHEDISSIIKGKEDVEQSIDQGLEDEMEILAMPLQEEKEEINVKSKEKLLN